MTLDKFIEGMRQEIREEGFISVAKLSIRIEDRAKEFEVNVSPVEILGQILCKDIRTIEYANWTSKNHNLKKLYYFLPNDK